MNIRSFFAALTLTFLFASIAGAQGNPIIYPARGQSNQQTEQDKFECYSWAKQQTGFDPMQAQQAPPPPKQGPTGEVVKGAAVGAVGGVAIGAIAGDAGKGAAIGAAGGALFGGIKKKRKQEAEAQAQQQQSAAIAAGRSEYNRALGACLEGRGYTVK
jgi:hypothetical protein